MLSTPEAWHFIMCNFYVQSKIKNIASDSSEEQYLQNCALYPTPLSVPFADLKSCAINTTSAAWAKESGDATSKAAESHPLWVVIDGAELSTPTDVDQWATAVLAKICSNYKAANPAATLPAGCN